jgi:hypothetical protein
MTLVHLVELTGYTDAEASAVYRFATAPYSTTPTDAPPSTHYEGRVLGIGSISRSMFAPGQSGARSNPRSEVGVGVITLANVDGGLDSLFDGSVSFRERCVEIRAVQAGAAYSTAALVLRAVISQAALRADTVEISIKDRLYELSSDHSTAAYGGTNALPAGVDGTAELAGTIKPMAYGKVFAAQPPCVNTSRLIYQLSARALASVDGVYDGGLAITAGATYADQAAMEAAAPSAGQYRAWLAGGMIRLGTSPVYRITADCTADSAANSTAAQLLKTLATARGISSSDISAADVAALDADTTAVLGVLITGGSTLDAMDLVARSVGAYYGFDRLGMLRMRRYGLPAGSLGLLPVVARWNTQAIEQQPNGEDVPTQTVRIRYARYWQPLSPGEFAGAVVEADRADMSQQWRTAQYEAAPSPNPYQRPLVAERETALTTEADALAEARRLHSITAGVRRTFLASGVSMADPALSGVDIDTVVEVRWDRYGLGDLTGTALLVIQMDEDLIEQRAELLLWGG